MTVALSQYLDSIRDIYKSYGASLHKQVLSDIGVIGEVSREATQEDTEKDIRAIKKLMEKYGDYF